MKRQVADRLFLSTLTLMTCLISVLEPKALAYILVRDGGVPAELCMAVLAVLSMACMADTVVNDILSESYSWRCGVRYRQALWALLGCTWAGIAFVTARYPSGGWVATVYVLYAARCMGMAYMDLWHEHQARMRSITGTAQ